MLSIFLGISLSFATISIERSKLLNNLLDATKKHQYVNFYGLSGMGKTFLIKILAKKKPVIYLHWSKHSIHEQIDNVVLSNNKLVVIDNYNERSLGVLKKGFPELMRYRLIIVSQQKIPEIVNIECVPFSDDEAIGLAKVLLPNESTSQLSLLIKQLAGYPYYIVAFCKFIKESGTFNLERLRTVLKDHSASEFLDHNSNVSKAVGSKIVSSLIRELKIKNPEAFEILAFLSTLDSKDIPLKLIECFTENKVDQGIECLIENSFISNVNKAPDFISYDVHDISRRLVFDELNDQEKKDVKQKGINAFFRFFKEQFSKTYDMNREDQVFYSHLLAFLDKFAPTDELLPLNVLSIKRYLYSKRNVKYTKILAEKVDRFNPVEKIKDKDVLFEYFLDWAFVHCFYYTEKHFDKGIKFALKAMGCAQNDEQLFRAVTRAMWLHLYVGDLKGALSFFSKADNLFAETRDIYARKEFYFGASWLFLEKGVFDKSYQYALEGIKLDEGSKNANVGLYLYSFKAICEHEFEQHEKAIKTINYALEKEKKVFGGEISLAGGELLQVKANVLLSLQKIPEAEQSVSESLKIFEKLKGKEPYHATALSKRIFSQILLMANKPEEAKIHCIRSLEMYKKLNTEYSYDSVETMVLMGKIHLELLEYEELNSLFKKMESNLGLDNEHTSKLFNAVAASDKLWAIV